MSGSEDIVSETAPNTTPRSALVWTTRALFLAAVGLCVWLFVNWFDFGDKELTLVWLWLGSLLAWALFVFTCSDQALFGIRPRLADYLPLAVLLPLFVAGWLPFYDNWRWAYTGDSFSVYGLGHSFAQNGLRQNLLSVHGIDNSFTILWESTYYLPMYFFGEELFWLRVGQVLMACAALAAIYAYFRMVIGRFWASVVVVATATNYVWLWMTYVSYLKIDSNVFYFVMLIWTTLIWRRPQHLGLWMMAGFTAGLALFYTPAAWAGIMCMGLFVAGYGLAQRRVGAVAIAGASALLIAVPILIEIPWMLEMLRHQTLPMDAQRQSFFPGFGYVYIIFREIMRSPYFSYLDKLGVSGAFFRLPFDHAYLGGLAIGVLAVIPPLRRRLRIPAFVPALLALLVFDAMFLALTNKGYGNVSHKRSYNLIPLQVFFAVLPFYMLYVWGGARRWWRQAVVALVAAALVVSAHFNLLTILHPHKAMYGGNLYDGMIELRQRYPERKVWLFTTRDFSHSLTEDGLFQFVYGILDNLTMVRRFNDVEVDGACAADALLCYEPNFDSQRFDPLVERNQTRLVPFEVINSHEMRCYRCTG